MFLCLGQLEKKTWSSGEEHGLRTEDSNISTWMVIKDKKVGEIIQGEMTEEKQAQDRAPWHSKSQGSVEEDSLQRRVRSMLCLLREYGLETDNSGHMSLGKLCYRSKPWSFPVRVHAY